MKTSSFLAAIGVGLLILNSLFFVVANVCEAWQYEWYNRVGTMLNMGSLIAWILIGQFFITLYRKSK